MEIEYTNLTTVNSEGKYIKAIFITLKLSFTINWIYYSEFLESNSLGLESYHGFISGTCSSGGFTLATQDSFGIQSQSAKLNFTPVKSSFSGIGASSRPTPLKTPAKQNTMTESCSSSGRKRLRQEPASLNESNGPNVVLGVDIESIGKPDYTKPEVANHKKQFDKWLSEYYENAGTTTFVITKAELEFVKEVVLGRKQYEKAHERFKFRYF